MKTSLFMLFTECLGSNRVTLKLTNAF